MLISAYTQALFASIPDFQRKERKISLAGELPQYTDQFKGCVFHTRCRYATEICKTAVPPTLDMGGGHCVSCHLYSEEMAQQEKAEAEAQVQ